MHVLDDGTNETQLYAEAPLLVGAATSVSLSVTEPDGVEDRVSPAPEFSRDVRLDVWDMSSASDVSRTDGLTAATYDAGVFTASSTSNDPQLILLDAATNPVPVSTSTFRYLTAKIRVTGAGTHFMNAFWFTDPATFGFTDGIVVENGQWQILTLDLTDQSNASSLAWRANPTMSGLRLDPTTQAGATVEIDWITLSGDTSQAEYTVRWAVDNLPNSTFSVFVGDDEATVEMVQGLAPGARSTLANLSRFPNGTYRATVVADPGPTAVSTGVVTLGDDLIFTDGFQ